MRAFTAFTFGKTEIEIKVQMFMLQGTNQPLIAGGWEDTFPHGQVPHGLLPTDFSQGWRGPTGCNCSCSSVFPGTSILHLRSQSPFLSPSWASSTLRELRGKGGQPRAPAQPLPMSPGPKLLISSFFFTSHLSFRSLFCQPFLSLLFRLPFFLPQT